MKALFQQRVASAIGELIESGVFPAAAADVDIRIDLAKDKTHGDFATNIAMMLAKAARMKPRDIAERLIEVLPALTPEAQRIDIAGPGFINFFLSQSALATHINEMADDPRLGVPLATTPQNIVVDYSAPNLAKEMHVGHLRSTIIGDSLLRVLEFLGHKVTGQNHVGDWGTQFGMLLAYFDDMVSSEADLALNDLESFYQAAKARFDNDSEFADRARELVVKLQSGDPDCVALWQRFNDITLSHCQEIYDRLDVKLTRDNVYGESRYNDDLANVVSDLQERGLLTESDGAQCVFLDDFTNKEGDPLPLIVRKADGGYLYATTDLAAVRYRVRTLNSQRVLYIVDQRQALHFEQVFAVARKAGFVPEGVSLEHMGFGTMNGEDGRPFRTRAGGTVKLASVLDEAQRRALTVVSAKLPDADHEQITEIANTVAVSAVKYADLSKHRATDYVFSFDQMLSFDGNTAPYMLYAFARIASVLRRAEVDRDTLTASIAPEDERERALSLKLLQFSEVVHDVAARGTPHVLCTYLYELATLYSSFYEHCPILKNVDANVQDSRLRLSATVSRTLQQGMSLLGIRVLQRM